MELIEKTLENKKNICKECYSNNPRITPIREAKKCLTNHRQYVCDTCGRILCVDLKGEKKARCFFPFTTLETAILYLKAAEIISGKLSGIYELIYKRGDKRYKIFSSYKKLESFLKRNSKVICNSDNPVYISTKLQKINSHQIKYLNKGEIIKYLAEMKNNNS